MNIKLSLLLYAILVGILVSIATWQIKQPVQYKNYGIVTYKLGFPFRYGQKPGPGYESCDITNPCTTPYNAVALIGDVIIWSILATIILKLISTMTRQNNGSNLRQ